MNGLSSSEARQKLLRNGHNEIPSKQENTALILLLRQFKSPLTYLLLAATLFSWVIGDKIDGVLIFFILVLNTVLGFYQEYKASKELQALKKIEVAQSRCLRDGKQVEIPSHELVEGDVVILEPGDKIPADCKIIESYNLTVNESSLTGESLPVIKSFEKDKESAEGKLFMGTTVVTGRAKALVTYTGLNTRFGRLALNLSKVESDSTPLEKNLTKLSQTIALAGFIISVILFALRIFHEVNPRLALLESVAVLVAAVPEGLPTAITFILVVGVRRMYHKKTLVRKLAAIESLGSTTVICTDKTGTLTENKLSVQTVESIDEKAILKAAVLCNSAQLIIKDSQTEAVLGDETEGALLLWAKKQGINIDELRSEHKLIEEAPFDSKLRYMAVEVSEGSKKHIYIKGAPETVFEMCSLSEKEKTKALQTFEDLSQKGLRVLAFAERSTSPTSLTALTSLTFLGLIGISDTIREEAVLAVRKAQKAGIKVVMITGDNELTAKHIGEKVGILKENDEVLLGDQLDELTDEELDQKINQVAVFARCVPEHKLRIVQSFQRRGEVVAVTGDGVNDALALKQAEIGVAMGSIGTDVAKEASDMVILDDNLSTIVEAVEQGRLIYSNILKTVKFLMAGNLSEVAVIFITGLLGFPAPLQPVQILWINFVTDGLPAMSLALDSSSGSLMRNKPRSSSETLLGRKNAVSILVAGFIMSGITSTIYIVLTLQQSPFAQAATFTAVVLVQMVYIFLLRKNHSLTSNKYLLYSVASVIVMQGIILAIPELRHLFKVEGF